MGFGVLWREVAHVVDDGEGDVVAWGCLQEEGVEGLFVFGADALQRGVELVWGEDVGQGLERGARGGGVTAGEMEAGFAMQATKDGDEARAVGGEVCRGDVGGRCGCAVAGRDGAEGVEVG